MTSAGNEKLKVALFFKKYLQLSAAESLALTKQAEVTVIEGYWPQARRVLDHLQSLGATVFFRPIMSKQ